MKYRVIILSRAEFDEAEIYDYLAERSAAAAQRFIDKVDDTLQRISSTPTPGIAFHSENPKLAGLRWTKVRDFPKHLIFFRLSGDLIEVARILHGARDLATVLGE